MPRWRRQKASAVPMARSIGCPSPDGRAETCGRMRQNTTRFVAKSRATATKQATLPAKTSTTPASAGPASCETLKTTELSAIAAGTSARGTSSLTTAFEAACERPTAMPTISVSTTRIGRLMSPVTMSSATVAAWNTVTACAARTIRPRGKRSASTPPNRPSSIVGANLRKLIAPSQVAEPVSSQTSQPSARRCIHSPIVSAACPAMYRP